MTWLLVAVGGAIGSLLRYGAGMLFHHPQWPLGTWLVNAAGSFLIGAAFVWFREKGWGSPDLYLFLATGVLGGFTTFSAFSLEVVSFWLNGQALRACGYMAASLAGGILGVLLGVWTVRHLV